MKDYTDKSGRELQVGDYIIYGSLLGRCAGLKYGKIMELTEAKVDTWKTEHEGRLKIKIVSVNDNWSHLEPELCKPGYLEFSERILKITKSQIPVVVLYLLDKQI